jgi:hypothetical protein
VAAAQGASASPPAPPLDPAAVRDTIAAVFAHADYDRTLRQTLLGRLASWLGELLRSVAQAASQAPRPVYWVAVALLVTLALLIAARIAYGAYLRRDQGAALAAGRGGSAGRAGRDAWRAAQELAARGDYTEAAHALYQALLQALAARERVRLHPSKTVGDYRRELRARSSSLLGRFGEFARSYEAVVYGGIPCDAARFERLHALAAPVVAPDG